MTRFTIILGGFLFIAASIVTLISDKNWQSALFLFAIGAAFIIVYIRDEF